MTYCSHCDLVHGEEHRFCQVCGQLLKRSSAGLRACARCGAPTLSGQKFCTDCGLPLRVLPAERQEPSPARTPVFYPRGSEVRASSRRRRRPLFALLILVLVVLGGWLLIWTGRKTMTFIAQAFTSKPQETSQAPTQDNLKPEVEKLAEKIRAAHLNKDINKWLSCYSPSYPHLGQLESAILELWKDHDIKEVSYRISGVQRLGPRQATAVVVWSFQLYDHRQHDYQLMRQSYRVTLEKTNGDWKIRESKEELEPKA
jgi:predicted nucleic acid-binding Zn ribbon protein|uniref:Zinc ribbon domain-containing protein n=1 Tax=Desulfobacca acetoxidans TaxID=60893 RepID=A0A7C5ET39_9BACT